MDKPIPKMSSYQDLRVSLVWLSTVFLIIFLACFFLLIVPDSHRTHIYETLDKIGNSAWLKNSVVAGVIGLSSLSCLAVCYVLFGIFNVHQRYDSSFIKWRHYYDVDYIMPRLVQPFAEKIDPRFYQMAADHRRDFMKLYYKFIGDHGLTQIPENYKVRFYERALVFWATQVGEIYLLLSFLALFVYMFVYHSMNLDLWPVTLGCFILALLFIINRLLANQFLKELKRNTQDQIDAVHEKSKPDLEWQLSELHKRFNLKYRGHPKNPNQQTNEPKKG